VRRAFRLLLLATAGTIATLLLAAAAVCLGSGCSSVGYYGQAVAGHIDLMNRARPVPEVMADAGTEAALRERLKLSQQMRDFAVTELALPDNPS
jgi:predicted aminopeptidase